MHRFNQHTEFYNNKKQVKAVAHFTIIKHNFGFSFALMLIFDNEILVQY